MLEKALKMDISPDDRTAVILCMLTTYQTMGYTDKALALAERQNSIVLSRELLLAKASEGESGEKYSDEARLALLVELKHNISSFVYSKISEYKTNRGIKRILLPAKFIEEILEDDISGAMNIHLCELYLEAARLESRWGKDYDKAMKYFDKTFDYKKRYADAMADGKYANAYQLGAKVTFPTGNFKNIDPQFWHGWVGILQKELGDRIKANPKYAECFE